MGAIAAQRLTATNTYTSTLFRERSFQVNQVLSEFKDEIFYSGVNSKFYPFQTCIRKVLGASVPSLIALLLCGFFALMLIAFLLTIRAAYYMMTLSWATSPKVSDQSVKAMLTNLVQTLRAE